MYKLYFLVLAILPLSAFSQDHYISNSGNDKNPGTEAAPWATIEKAEKEAHSGDNIYLQRGSKWITQFNIPGDNITIDAYGKGANPIIDGSSEYFSITSVGKSFITIRNLRLTNSKNDCVRIDQKGTRVHHIRVENNIIDNCSTNGIQFMSTYPEMEKGMIPYNITVLNNRISNCGNTAIQVLAQADIGENKLAWNIIDRVGLKYPTNAITLAYVHNIVVEHNTITNTHSTDIDGSGITADRAGSKKHYVGNGSIIRYNKVTCPSPPINKVQAGIAVWYQPNVKIYENDIYKCNTGIRVSGNESKNYNIYNNNIHVLKRGASFTSKAPKGIFHSNKITGHNKEAVGFYASRGSHLPTYKANETHNMKIEVTDDNN